MAEGEMKRGRVKFYKAKKGFGFITPDDGSKDLFFHQSAIKIEDFRSLDGESVEFMVNVGKDGRAKAMNVTGRGGGSVQWRARGFRSVSNGDSSSASAGVSRGNGSEGGGGNCKKSGESGHMAKDGNTIEFTDGGVGYDSDEEWLNSAGNKERVEKNVSEPDVEVHQKMIIIKVAISVAMSGKKMEESIFVQRKGDPLYNFLLPGDPNHVYYQSIVSEQLAKNQNDPFYKYLQTNPDPNTKLSLSQCMELLGVKDSSA